MCKSWHGSKPPPTPVVSNVLYCHECFIALQENEDESWTGPVDKDGFPVGRVPDDKKKIEALPPVDHSEIEVGKESNGWMDGWS